MTDVPAPRGMYFEDFEIDQVLRTGRRTITSTDIVDSACLSGEFNDVHTDHDTARPRRSASRSRTVRWYSRSRPG